MTGPIGTERSRKMTTGQLRTMFDRQVVVNALKVSLFVGTCLNAINQGPSVWRGEPVTWSKILLNYLVPFLVSSYSAAKARRMGGG